MQLTWHGLTACRLQEKEVTIDLDPFSEKSGIKPPRWFCDIIAISTDQADGKIAGESFVIDTPGEYEIKDVFIYGVPWRLEKKKGNAILYRVNISGVSVVHLGALDRVIPNEALEVLEGADVLIIPIGHLDQLSAKEAVEVVSRIAPRIIVGIDYDV